MARGSLVTDPNAMVQLTVKVPQRVRKQFQLMVLAQDCTVQERLAQLIERDLAENSATVVVEEPVQPSVSLDELEVVPTS